MKCVHAFCRSEEGLLVDTESYRVFVVHNLVTTKKEKHSMQVWHDAGLTGQYLSFCESKAYARFRSNTDQLTICKEVLCTSVCKCVRDPSPHSCVDFLCSILY